MAKRDTFCGKISGELVICQLNILTPSPRRMDIPRVNVKDFSPYSGKDI